MSLVRNWMAVLGFVVIPIVTASGAFAEEPRGSLRELCMIPSDFNWNFENVDNKLLGVWDGAWGENRELAHTLIVHKVKGDKVSAFYATAEYEPWGAPANCYSVPGTIEAGDTMQFKFPGISVVVKYTLNEDGNLDGTYTRKATPTSGSLRRIAKSNAAAGPNDKAAASCVQQNLNTLGYAAGEADGVIGRKSLAGAEAFRAATPDTLLPPLSKHHTGIWCATLNDAVGNAAPPEPLTLHSLNVPAKIIPGQTYTATMPVTLRVSIDHLKGCFSWSGEGPYCFPAKYENGTISTLLRTGNPNTYELEAYVTYSANGEQYESQKVVTTLIVK